VEFTGEGHRDEFKNKVSWSIDEGRTESKKSGRGDIILKKESRIVKGGTRGGLVFTTWACAPGEGGRESLNGGNQVPVVGGVKKLENEGVGSLVETKHGSTFVPMLRARKTLYTGGKKSSMMSGCWFTSKKTWTGWTEGPEEFDEGERNLRTIDLKKGTVR